MIIGLEDDMYCAHTPIPVRVTGVSADTIRMQIYIDDEPMLSREPLLCQDLNGDFLIDLSPWIKQFMPSFRDNMTYQPGMQYNPNPQAMDMRVEFYSQDGFDEAERTFVNCATKDWRLIDNEFINVKVWQCYPFSSMLTSDTDSFNILDDADFSDGCSEAVRWAVTNYNAVQCIDNKAVYTTEGTSTASRIERIINLQPGIYTLSFSAEIGTNFDFSGQNINIISSESNDLPGYNIHWVTFEVISGGTNSIIRAYYRNRLPDGSTFSIDWFVLNRGSNVYRNFIPSSDYSGEIYYGIPSTDAFALPGKSVEYNADCCRGIYVKWLNRYGYYSYWLFPDRYTRERSADEYYKVTQNIFDSNRDGSHRTVGFEAEDIITIRDKVSRKYIGMFADLVSSPEVQILKPDYVLGGDVTPDDWIRIIQDNPEMEDDAVNSTFDFEMDFTLPKRYTQTLI